ncbi:hypothetical protein EV126DRAFT_21782 [Verticillium dahliae]|nr:hypothetical protein EV126DRAFT_21782 [Verticillium dahliae]
MYGPGYGSNPNVNVPPTFNNAAPPPHHNHNPHLQPGALSSQQPPQMYNPNQFAGGMPQGQQPSFPGAGQPNPAIMSGPGPAGMMQSTAMPQMPTNGQPNQSKISTVPFVICPHAVTSSVPPRSHRHASLAPPPSLPTACHICPSFTIHCPLFAAHLTAGPGRRRTLPTNHLISLSGHTKALTP